MQSASCEIHNVNYSQAGQMPVYANQKKIRPNHK